MKYTRLGRLAVLVLGAAFVPGRAVLAQGDIAARYQGAADSL